MKKINQTHTIEDVLNEPIAIVGMNCQFPGVDSDIEDVVAFHEMLMKGQTPIKEVPKNRWDIDEYYDPDRKKADKVVSRKGGFLNNTHLFDASYFKISSAQAKQIDPQHRLFLEVSIRALNHANIRLDSLSESNTGVYCGISTYEYSQLNYKDNIKFNAYTPFGVANSAAVGRLSHFLNLKGPSMAVDTACSSSLTALHLAATALRTQQCNMAIVGGVHLSLSPNSFIGLTKANMLSATGQCSSFDISADGFARSEGCGVVIVKRLSDALRDNDTIHAVIKSIVMNQDGEGLSLASPNIKAQIAMHQEALAQANLTASDIDYIEAHGTATVVGDSVEFNAIQSIHQGHHSKDKPLTIGALKSNLGHTMSSSGIASLIKVICALKNETIPPNLHYSTPNKAIDPEAIPARFPVKPSPFIKHKNKKRFAQVSNFSFSGTNVSAILEESPNVEFNADVGDNSKPICFVISASSEYSLKQMMADYLHYLKNSTSSLSDICYTLINCRDHYKFRCAIVANDKKDLIKKIESEDYELKKVTLQKDIKKIVNEAHEIVNNYLSGVNIRLDIDNAQYNKLDLPLYYFDRKPYWHESRNNTQSSHWLDTLYLQPIEQQLETIKTKVASHIHAILKKESIDEHQNFESLGFTKPLLKELDSRLLTMFSQRYKRPSTAHLTLDDLARHIQQIITPPAVLQKQPTINVLDVEPIAIIGMSCRFPKAANIDEFLALLKNGESGMADIPLERWDNDLFYDSDVDALGKLYIKQLGLIDNVANFDAEFFNISPREAKLMSPQLRILLETSYHAIEHANLALDSLKESNTGVFIGCERNDYPQALATQGLLLESLNIYFATGNALSTLTGRVAYAFDFHGPIQVVDTACSSAMTAIHNACQSLQSGDCSMALAGGINILLSPFSNITLSKARMLSPDSRCKTFSEDADGYARSEGCGIVVLKRLSVAIKDNDNILAVIKGSSVNCDGKSAGFTVPNGAAQEAVIRSALAKSKLSPSDIDYIETHGTGTPVADPIEVKVLSRIFSEHHSKERPLYISSVKTNIGHCESASGVAGIIKAIFSLNTRTFFKHLNFKKLNPEIQLKNTIIPLQNIDWAKEDDLRYAGVNSFGFSGANAHVILQQAPGRKKVARTLPQESLLVLSAKKRHSLELLLLSYQKYLSDTEEEFADICYTAATCRSHFLFRVSIKASSAEQAAEAIKNNDYTILRVKKEQNSLNLPASLEQLQEAFHNGLMINWSDYYKDLGYQFEKVQLPLYEFVRAEYWFSENKAIEDAPVPINWCSQLNWQYQIIDKNNHKTQGTHWLLIGAQQLASSFSTQGLQMVLEDENYSLDQLDGIIFAAGLDTPSPIDIDSNIEFQKNTIKKLLSLVKVLNHTAIELQLIVLTTHGIAELADDTFNISNSSLIGFCRSLILELPQYNTVLIDLDKTDGLICTEQVLDEINHNHGQYYEHMIAYRDGKRMIIRLNRIELVDNKIALDSEARYLITGGSGGLGFVTAQALLSAGARELILISRTVDEEAAKKLLAYYPGRIIHTKSLDITDKEGLRNLLLQSNQDGLLKGIIHAAGAAYKAPLIEHKDEDVDHLFSAKVQGGWYLHELSQHCNLDFFVTFSSISSVFGSNKESVYGATNSFLDALIAERHRLGLPGTSIQWGAWGEAGIANKLMHNQAPNPILINNRQGHALIKVLINGLLSHVTISSPKYLEFMLDFVPKPPSGFHKYLIDDLKTLADTIINNSVIESVVKQNSAVDSAINKNITPWLRDYLEISEENRFDACKELLSSICKKILELAGMEDSELELDEDDGFFDIGFDSLMLTEIAFDLKDVLEPLVKVTVSIAFDYPSINKLSQHIKSELDSHLFEKQVPTSSRLEDDSIAIIGMSCSFPNAPDIVAFERLIEDGMSGMKDIPMERWDNRKFYDPNMDAPRKSYVNKLGLIENIKCFDAQFFGISPREAKMIEPQQRIFLECCYKALENANHQSKSLRGSLTGVYAGVGPNEYYGQLEQSGFSNVELSAYSITGNALNMIPGRVAYTFDFKGPSISVDTACSSSLVAIHYACQSLKNREIDYALAGGVNILLMPESNVTLSKAKALSPDGLCKTFDASADGYARSEGCGVIFLKRLTDALRDKDNILAVIKGSAVNNDGKSAGLTVPNGKSQEAVMMKALSQTELTASDISYIEAHGTGTPLGDPIEVHAINAVYGEQRSEENPLYLGTVKTNIGHLECASGVAAVIKTVISLQKKTIYKHLNFSKLNPHIQINGTRIALQNTDWNTNSKLKCAGVNAFGFSGTNAHLILQEHPINIDQRKTKPAKTQVLVLSAKSKISLDKLAIRYQHYLETTQHDFSDICFTSSICRDHYAHRLVLVAENSAEAARLLSNGQFAYSHRENNTLDIPNNRVLKALLINYLHGKDVDWLSYYKTGGHEYIKVTLPNYTFDRSEFWPDKKSDHSLSIEGMHPILGQMIAMPGNEYLFSNKLDLESLSYISQHSVFGKLIFPASAYIESGLTAAKSLFKRNALCVKQFTIERPLYPKQSQEIQFQVKPVDVDRYKIKVFANHDDNWQVFSEMEIEPISSTVPESVDINVLKSFYGEQVDVTQIYEHFKQKSLFYGDEFQVLQEGYINSDSILTKIALSKRSSGHGYYFHPALLDGAMQSIVLLSSNNVLEYTTFVPYAFTRMVIFQQAPKVIWAHLTKRNPGNQNELCFDIKLYDTSGLQFGDIQGLKLRKVTQNNFISYESTLKHLYQTKWTTLNLNINPQIELPEFIVISNDVNKAKRVLGDLNYQIIQDVSNLVSIENKNIIFLYEQGQFLELFHCCQTLFKCRPNSFILVTEQAYSINASDKVNPYHTMASSFWKSFRNELDLHKNYTVDIDSNSTLIGVLSYLFNTNSMENQLAVRDSIYIARLKKIQLTINNAQPELLFDSEASYLITGGTGGLAKLLINYLIHRGVKQIIVTSRSECPSETKVLIESLRQHHVHLKHYVADASSYQEMEHVIEDIARGSKPLKGIFHLAGGVQDGLIVNLSDEAIRSVLSAKMDSALILHQLTKNIPLDLFVLFSSSASILGARGQANYVAANGFLDGLAHLRKQQDLPAIAINWGPFNTGMTANLTQALKQNGFILLDKNSIEILDVLLKSQLTQIAPCPIHWDLYFKHSPKQIGLSDLVKNTTPPDQHFLNSLRQHSQEECILILRQALSEITSDVLALDDVDKITAKAGLFSLGLDSLMSIEIRNRIHDKLQCPSLNLSIEYFINDPSIDKIARYIAEELQSIFDNTTDSQLSDNSTEEEIALCDFQYVFWVINKLGYGFNIGMQLQLHGKLNKEYVFQAFDFVVKQNKTLWIHFNEEVPTQTIKKQGQFELIYKDISLSNDSNALRTEFYMNTMRRIPLTEQPLIRVYLYKINNDLHELHLLMPHIIADDVSCGIVFNQFKINYEALTLGKKLIPIPTKESYFNFVKHNNFHYEKNLGDKIDFWRNYNKDLRMLYFGHANHLPDAASYQTKYLFHYPIAPELMEQFIDWHKERNINVSTGLVAACHLAFYTISLQKKLPITLIHSGREGSQYKSVIGLFSEYKRINVSLNEDDQFIDYIKSIEEELLKTVPYQKCSHLIKNSGLRNSLFSIGEYLATLWNKFSFTKHFKDSKLDSTIIHYYLQYLSQAKSIKNSTLIKYKLNKLFKWNMPLKKPSGLRTLISITPSFFDKENCDTRFADLNYSFGEHFSCVDRPVGNKTLWVYFSRDQFGEYLLSINGPLTTECKDRIACEFNKIISKFIENDEHRIADLVL